MCSRFRTLARPLWPAALLGLFALAPAALFAQEAVVWKRSTQKVALGPHLEVLHEQSGRLLFSQVQELEFTPAGQAEPSFGFLDRPIWLRLRVDNVSEREEKVVLEIADFFLRQVDFFFMTGAQVRHGRTGARLPPDRDPSLYAWPAIELRLPPASSTWVYLRVETDTGYTLPVHLYSPVAFAERIGRINVRMALNYGIGVFIFLSSLFIWLRLRDRTYLFYLLFQFVYTLLILALDGLMPKIDAPPLPPDSLLRVFAGSYPLVVVFFCEFFLEFARMGTRLPRIRLALRVVQGAMLLVLPVLAFDFRAGSILCWASLPPLILFFSVVGILLWVRGYAHMRYMLFACLPVLLMGALLAGSAFGVFAHGFLFEELKSVNILSAVILAISLADRYSLMERGYSRLLRNAVEDRTGTLLKEKLRTEEIVRQKEQLVRMVSHDIRSPLSAIKTNLPFLRKSPPLPEADRNLLVNEIEDTVEKLLVMSARLGEADPGHAGRPMIEPEWCSARELAAGAFRDLAGKARKKQIEVVNSIPEDHELLVDRRLLTRVLYNLVSNAVKFSRKGDRVEASSWPAAGEEGGLRLTIADTGVGIPPEVLPDLLDPAVETITEGTELERGSGLGLKLCREIAVMHGGEVRIESPPGLGTRAHFDLPAFRFRRSTAGPTGPGRVVLVVDDYEPFREQLRFLLRKKDIAVVEAGDGKQALRILDRLRPDLVVTDMVMPEIDGPAFIRQIRSGGREIPVWVISGGALDGKQEERARAAGADRFFLKPLDIGRFRAEIDELVRKNSGAS